MKWMALGTLLLVTQAAYAQDHVRPHRGTHVRAGAAGLPITAGSESVRIDSEGQVIVLAPPPGRRAERAPVQAPPSPRPAAPTVPPAPAPPPTP